MIDPKYHLQVFGGLSAHVAGRATPMLAGQRKRLALLATIASEPSGGIARDRLLTLFWPESDFDRARNALKQLVHAIRRELGADAIVDVSGTLTIDPAVMTSDVQEFRAAFQAGDLERAVTLYRGEFLEGVYLRDVADFERWAEKTRQSLAVQYSTALEQLVASTSRAGDCAAAVRWARTLAAVDPLSTRAALVLMQALSASGDAAGAIRHGELHASLLRQELEVDAPRELRDALEALRASQQTVDVPRRAVPSANAIAADDVRSPVEADAGRPVARRRRARPAALGGAIVIVAVATFAMSMRPGHRGFVPARPGTLVPLTYGQSAEVDPALSPDGKWLAYAASPPGEPRVRWNARIYVRPMRGGSAVPITSDSLGIELKPRWSPDGTRIAFLTATGIYIVPALGGTPRLLVPGGRHNRDLGGENLLRFGDWSHDGLRISYADSTGIWIRDVAGGTDRLVTRTTGYGAQDPTWSPDDERIAFSVGTGGAANVAPSSIWIVPADGGESVQLTDAEHLNTSPQFAPDGRSIFYVSNRDGARDIYQQRLPVRRGENVLPTRMTTGANAISISITADGHHLVYGAELMRSNVWSAPIRRSEPTPAADMRPVTQGNQEVECLSVSRDGAWLLYDSNRSGNQDLYKMPLGGGEPIQLTTDPADDFCPTLSPDGREIAFYSFRGTGNRRVFTMLSGGERQAPALEVQPNEQEWAPGWSPDGQGLIFDAASTGERHVSLVSRHSNARWNDRRDLYSFGIEGGRWLPDGRHLVALSRDSGVVLLSPNGRLVRVLAPISKSEMPTYVAPGSDAETIYYRTIGRHLESSFWAVPISGGPPRLLLRLNDSKHASRRVEFDTDGKSLLFTISTDDANVWQLELLR